MERARLFSDRGLGCTPALLESLGIEEPQSRKIYRNGARRQLSLLEQFRLVFANLLGAQTVWRTLEASREIFHYTDVTAYGSFSVITTLEFLQHHFSEMGHGDTSCDPHLHQTVEQPTLHYLTRSVRRRAASFKSSFRISASQLATSGHADLLPPTGQGAPPRLRQRSGEARKHGAKGGGSPPVFFVRAESKGL